MVFPDGFERDLTSPKTTGGILTEFESSSRSSSSALIPASFIILDTNLAHSSRNWFFAETLGILINSCRVDTRYSTSESTLLLIAVNETYSLFVRKLSVFLISKCWNWLLQVIIPRAFGRVS